MLLLICNRELLFIGKRKDEDDMAKSTKTYEERIRALEKKEQESIEGTKKLIAQRKELEKRKKAEESKKRGSPFPGDSLISGYHHLVQQFGGRLQDNSVTVRTCQSYFL